MESGDANEFRQSEWRRLLGLLDRRKRSNVVSLDDERKKRAARTQGAEEAGMGRPQGSGPWSEENGPEAKE